MTLSGQISRTADGIVPEDPIAQLEVALENVAANLEAAQMEVDDLVKLTIYLVGGFDPAARQVAIKAFLRDYRPCVTMLFIAGLANPIYKVEIEALACQSVF